jgi:hypothetical protein
MLRLRQKKAIEKTQIIKKPIAKAALNFFRDAGVCSNNI